MNSHFSARIGLFSILLIPGLLLTGCSSTPSAEYMDAAASAMDHQQSDYTEDSEPSDAEIDAAMQEAAEQFGWSCFYDPTLNDDWHDDVLCRLGNQFDRPYLREWDDFVTEDELMDSAAEYEAQLNAG